MTATITTPEFTTHELNTLHDATREAYYKVRDNDYAHPSLVDDVDTMNDLVAEAYGDALSALMPVPLEITPRQKQLLINAATAYGIRNDDNARQTVLDIVHKLEKAELA